MIAASIVAGIYGKKAAEMADRIDAVNKMISSDESEINAGNPLRVGATRIAAELLAVDVSISDRAPFSTSSDMITPHRRL